MLSAVVAKYCRGPHKEAVDGPFLASVSSEALIPIIAPAEALALFEVVNQLYSPFHLDATCATLKSLVERCEAAAFQKWDEALLPELAATGLGVKCEESSKAAAMAAAPAAMAAASPSPPLPPVSCAVTAEKPKMRSRWGSGAADTPPGVPEVASPINRATPGTRKEGMLARALLKANEELQLLKADST